MNLLIQLAGTNGSGKSAALKDMYEISQRHVYVNDLQGRGINATFLEDMKAVVIGRYHTDCGGGDGITGNGGLSRVTEAIEQVLNSHLYGYPVFFEGLLLASFVNMQRLAEIAKKYNMLYVVVHCDPSNAVCISRVYSRNNNKKINEANVTGRHDSLQRVMPRFADTGLATVIRWDNSEVDRDDMLPELLKLIREKVDA